MNLKRPPLEVVEELRQLQRSDVYLWLAQSRDDVRDTLELARGEDVFRAQGASMLLSDLIKNIDDADRNLDTFIRNEK